MKIFKILFVTCIVFLFSHALKAQPQKGQFIEASIGYGISVPNDNIAINGGGLYLEAEYVFAFKKWFGLRPYAGILLTWPEKNNQPIALSQQPNYEVSSKIFLLGGKARIAAPIPWFAPYFELGIGASVGTLKTFTPFTSIEKNGLTMHIPVTLGVALGPKNRSEVAFSYYLHPSAEQTNGAIAIGVSIPLNKE